LEESSRASESESEDESESALEEDDEVEDGGRTPGGVATAPKNKRTPVCYKRANEIMAEEAEEKVKRTKKVEGEHKGGDPVGVETPPKNRRTSVYVKRTSDQTAERWQTRAEEATEKETERGEEVAARCGAKSNKSPPHRKKRKKKEERADREEKTSAQNKGTKSPSPEGVRRTGDDKEVKDDPSQTATTVLGQQQLLAGGMMRMSLLEGIKILERRRPAEKFTGEDGKIDFEDHMWQFNKAMNLPGLPASQKVAELPQWFGGLARVQISKFMRREDHEEALKEAVAKLTKEHGNKADSAEEMLEEVLKGKALKPNDAVGMDLAVSKLENVYALAVGTDRDGDFNRKSLFKTVLTTLFPHLKVKWGAWLAKTREQGKTVIKFEDFLSFLTVHKRRAYEVQRLERPEAKPPGVEAQNQAKTKGKKADAMKATPAARKGTPTPEEAEYESGYEDPDESEYSDGHAKEYGNTKRKNDVGTYDGDDDDECDSCNDPADRLWNEMADRYYAKLDQSPFQRNSRTPDWMGSTNPADKLWNEMVSEYQGSMDEHKKRWNLMCETYREKMDQYGVEIWNDTRNELAKKHHEIFEMFDDDDDDDDDDDGEANSFYSDREADGYYSE
jgi:hypothetical protein